MDINVAGLCFTSAPGVAIHHNPGLVLFSYLIAVGGSFTALEMIERWRNARGVAARSWQAASAAAFGSSVWSMHFIGILALRESFPISHAPGETFLSLLMVIAAVGLGLEIVRGGATWFRIGSAGVAVGTGIAAMHYVGMAGLRFPGTLAYTPGLWSLSLLIAIVAATAGLWLALTLRQGWHRVVAAFVMGGAICGMHYTGMAAAVFRIGQVSSAVHGMPNVLLAGLVVPVTIALAICALVLVAADRRLFASELREAATLQAAYLKLETINAALEQGRLELDRKSRFFEATLQQMAEGIIMTDAGRTIQVMNRRMKEMFDLPETVGSGELSIFGLMRILWEQGEFGPQAGDFAAWVGPYAAARHKLERYEHRRPNGNMVEICWMPMSDGGEVRTYTDITQRKLAEAAMLAARDEADRAARAKSEFLAMMSHEIRSPMSGLVGVLELLRESGLGPDQLRMADMARGSAEVLLAVLNDILDFSKIEAGAVAVAPEPTSVRELVQRVAQPHGLEAARKGTELKLEYGAGLPDWVAVDPLRLMQILNNLLSNAVKFTPSGEILLTAEVVGEGAARRLCFAVRDSGIGMSAETIDRLFEPFAQADGSTTRVFGGTGLGLCISKRLARMMGGNLTVASSTAAGSIFTLLLPFVIAATPGAHDAEAAPLPFQIPAGCLRVLVVDDDLTNRWITQRQLELLGLRADTAEDGETALKMLRARRYDLVLTDCHMPRMDGVALTQALRAAAEPALSSLPVIGLTADVTAGQRERCLDAGMCEVAIKPLNRQRLSDLLTCHLPGGTQRVAAPAPAPAIAPVFNSDTYWELFAPGDPDGELCLGEFVAAAERLERELAVLFAVEPGASIRRDAVAATAHRLAGSAASIGAARFGAAAKQLELAAADGKIEALRDRFATVASELVVARAAIAEFIAERRLEAA